MALLDLGQIGHYGSQTACLSPGNGGGLDQVALASRAVQGLRLVHSRIIHIRESGFVLLHWRTMQLNDAI